MKTKEKIRQIVEDNSTKKGRILDIIIQVLIFSSLVSMTIETEPWISHRTRTILEGFEIVCVALFSIEYLTRIWVAKRSFKYIFSFYGLIDLLAILPYYLFTAVDFRALRIFRIFRVFRSLKLIRYNAALNRFHLAAKIAKEEIYLFLIITGIFIFLSSAGIYYFENPVQPEKFKSIFSSGWWAVVTLTTVGYGDVYPITVGGKIFTFFILLVGVGIVTIPAGLVASALSKAREMDDLKKSKP